MREVKSENFEKLESALLECLLESTNLDGLLLAPPDIDQIKIQMAAVQALTFLFNDWVRPDNVKFISGFASGEPREW